MWPWLGLLVAFSPVLLDLLANAAHDPADRATLLAPLLLALAWRSGPPDPPRPGLGLCAVLLGAVLELLGILAVTWTLARLGLPVAALGVALWTGRPRLPCALLAFFVVPVPETVSMLGAPWLESWLGGLAASLVALFGPAFTVSGPVIRGAGGTLTLAAADAGIPLAAALASLGWFAAVRAGGGLPEAVARAALAALLAPPLQLVALVVAVAVLALGHADAARVGLSHGPWLLAAAFTLAWTAHRERAPGRSPPSAPPRGRP